MVRAGLSQEVPWLLGLEEERCVVQRFEHSRQEARHGQRPWCGGKSGTSSNRKVFCACGAEGAKGKVRR